MRFYELILSSTDGQIYQPDSKGEGFTKAASGVTFTSHPNGQIDPGALNIEFDAVVYPFHTPQGGTLIRVWGVGLKMIGQAADLNPDPDSGRLGANVKLSAGMKPGLPLATATAPQAGLILQGSVLQSFGNWQGVNQTLELIINPSGTAPDSGFCFYWKANTSLKDAIASVLSQAMPGYTQRFSISSSLLLPHDEAGTYDNLQQFAGFLQEMTQADGVKIYGKQYSGVQIAIVGQQIRVFDNSTSSTAKQLVFTDLIGQPTWVDSATISFKTVLRADLAVGDTIKFPTTGLASPYVLTSPGAALPNVPARNKSIFQGSFTITEVHHFANLRQPDADSWATAFLAVPLPSLTTQ